MKQRSNQGLTLLELILGMAISSIIIGAIILFMSAGSRGYQNAQDEISLQTEAQTIMNQIREYALEGNNIAYDGANHTLSIYHSDGNAATVTDPVEIIWFNSGDHNMYLYHTTEEQKGVILAGIGAGAVSMDKLLGEYVEGFSVAPEKFVYDRNADSGTTLTVTLSMRYNGRTFEAVEDIKLRNKIVDIP
ncbi:MAG TPA: prepilin-type N-terminal cleavage/methylation domain-containing protein [Clostridiales bacterium]|nr:prepilin-type N-terminal cleavage/methylation domain-containing protein [Clostridiales bacterium]